MADLLVDQVAQELRKYRHSPMASCDLAAHLLAIPEIRDALELKYGKKVTLIVPDGTSVTVPSAAYFAIKPDDRR